VGAGFDRGHDLRLLAAEDGAATLAALVGDAVDLVPEADEVVDCGDDGDDGHPVDGCDGDEVDADGEAPEVPVVPAMVEDGGDDGDDLGDGFELAELAGFDGEAFGGGDGAEAADEELASDDEDGDPGRHDAGVVLDEQDDAGGDHELVGEGIEEDAEGGDLAAAAGEVAVHAVGDGGEDEDDGGEDLLLAREAVGGELGRQRPDEQRNACDAAQRDGVRQIHGTGSDTVILSQSATSCCGGRKLLTCCRGRRSFLETPTIGFTRSAADTYPDYEANFPEVLRVSNASFTLRASARQPFRNPATHLCNSSFRTSGLHIHICWDRGDGRDDGSNWDPRIAHV